MRFKLHSKTPKASELMIDLSQVVEKPINIEKDSRLMVHNRIVKPQQDNKHSMKRLKSNLDVSFL